MNCSLPSLLQPKTCNLKPKFGFTLIELLIVIAVIGILATMIMANLQGVRERARDARRKGDLDAIKVALRLYYTDQRSFPTNTVDGNINACGAVGTPCTWGTSTFNIGTTTYMNKLPLDPSSTSTSSRTYRYYRANTDSYVIAATLENGSDPDIAESQLRCATPYASMPLTLKDSAKDYLVCE